MKGKQPSLADDGSGNDGWRVVLLRALVNGDRDLVVRTLLAHVDMLSAPFAAVMPVWKLQWESPHWWMLREATPLFIASAHAHPAVIQWLVRHGADRSSRCHLQRTPLDVVGECCISASTDVAARVESCRKLLLAQPAAPDPPRRNVSFACHVASQVVVVATAPPLPPSPKKRPATEPQQQQQQQQVVHKCLVDVTWETPLANGAMIDKYELRYRVAAAEEESAVRRADDEDGDEGGSQQAPDAPQQEEEEDAKRPATTSWRVERAAHNRKTRTQGLMLDGLQFDCAYEVMLRSWSAGGRGDWSPPFKFTTVPAPSPAT
ncbi:hypothetical protein P43SY_002571 [Pythium insidiosum]|uniref:Fibronectin type-III domain-containing protein n=1 Tax=Pythium insidiosum TaxID=114742 RepID=A0AAD5LTP2_PYTIN|nr:hypothetical protein P43SY_002571 [Pythium insidiosum]